MADEIKILSNEVESYFTYSVHVSAFHLFLRCQSCDLAARYADGAALPSI